MLKRHGHHVALAAFVLAALAAIAVVLGFGVGGRSKDTVKQLAMQAAVQAESAPNPGCSPRIGTGHMGACAPTQAYAITDSLAKDAGDPETLTGVLGFDASNNNGCPITAIPVGAKFAFTKLTESTTFTDGCAVPDIRVFKARHLIYGVYDFLRPGHSTPAAEASHFVAAIKALGLSNTVAYLPPVADVEVNDLNLSPVTVQAYVASWVTDVRLGLGRVTRGPPVIIYTGAWFWDPQVGGGTNSAALWVSGYATLPLVPVSWGHHYTFWQYSDGTYGPSPHLRVTVAGASRGVDSDWFNGSLEQLDALAGIKPRRPKPPARTTTSTTPTRTRTMPAKPHRGALAFKASVTVSKQRVVWVTGTCLLGRCDAIAVLRAHVGLGRHNPVLGRWQHNVPAGKVIKYRFVLTVREYSLLRKHRLRVTADGNPHKFWLERAR